MKTLRTNCFETNSSSTHAYSLNTLSNEDLKPTQTFIADDDGNISTQITDLYSVENSLPGKLHFLVSAAYHLGDQRAFDLIRQTVENFTKAKLVIRKPKNYREEEIPNVTTVMDYSGEKEADLDDILTDTLSKFSYDDYCDIGTFKREFAIYTKSENTVKAFIFSNFSPVEEHTYYDG